MNEIHFDCPHCNTRLMGSLPRWSVNAKCPACENMLGLDYDEDWEIDSEYYYPSKEVLGIEEVAVSISDPDTDW